MAKEITELRRKIKKIDKLAGEFCDGCINNIYCADCNNCEITKILDITEAVLDEK